MVMRMCAVLLCIFGIWSGIVVRVMVEIYIFNGGVLCLTVVYLNISSHREDLLYNSDTAIVQQN